MKKNNKRKPLISALEPRILFDGAAVGTAVDVLDNNSFDSFDTTNQTNDSNTTEDTNTNEAPATNSLQKDRYEIAFVDENVDDYDVLVDGVDEDVEVFKISSFEQMMSILNDKQDVDAIHILSHGTTGEITIGEDKLNLDTLDTFEDQLQSLQNSLSQDADILLYGCNVASDGSGQEFIDKLATLTQADIAASDDITGAQALGGDWELEYESGVIETDEVEIDAFDGELGTPNISNLNNGSYTEGNPATIVDNDVTVSNGGTYSGGYIDFELTDGNENDFLNFQNNGSPSTQDGVLSVVDGAVYLGDGSSATVVGGVDSTLNGENGQKLRVNFSNEFENGDFNDGTAGETSIIGWTSINQQVKFGTDKIAGLDTPTDTTWPTNWDGDYTDQNTPSTLGTLETLLDSTSNDATGNSVRMTSKSMTTLEGYDIVRGPYIYSNSTVQLSAGDSVSFEWQAQGGGDAYDVYGYIVDINNNHIETILNETGDSTSASTTWATESINVSQSGQYKFVFVSGTYDYSGGRAAGAQLYIDNVAVTQANPSSPVNDNNIEALIQKLTYANSSDDPAASKSLKITAYNESNESGSATSTINITPVNDAPTLSDVTKTITDTSATDTFSDTTGTLSSSDVDDSTFTYDFSNGDSSQTGNYGTLSIESDGSYTYTPNDNAINATSSNVSDTFTIRTTDSGSNTDTNLSSTATFTVNIIAADDIPINTVPSDQSVKEDTPLVFNTENSNLILTQIV